DALGGLRLAHLLAVETLEELHDEDGLRTLSELLLQLAAREDVEELIRPAELHVGLHRHGVVRLDQGVEQVLDRDRRLLVEAASELLAREHLLRREARRELNDVAEPELPVPLVL